MLIYYNANPKNKRVGDCVKRAITVATGMEYHQVQLELNRYKKVTGASKFNSDCNCDKYVEKVLKAKWIPFKAVAGQPRMNGKSFMETHSKGSYILRMSRHWVACVDGNIYDTFNSTEKCVYGCWEVERVAPLTLRRVL